MCEGLKSGTPHHFHVHKINSIVVDIKKFKLQKGVIKLLEQIQVDTEHYVMDNIMRDKIKDA